MAGVEAKESHGRISTTEGIVGYLGINRGVALGLATDESLRSRC